MRKQRDYNMRTVYACFAFARLPLSTRPDRWHICVVTYTWPDCIVYNNSRCSLDTPRHAAPLWQLGQTCEVTVRGMRSDVFLLRFRRCIPAWGIYKSTFDRLRCIVTGKWSLLGRLTRFVSHDSRPGRRIRRKCGESLPTSSVWENCEKIWKFVWLFACTTFLCSSSIEQEDVAAQVRRFHTRDEQFST